MNRLIAFLGVAAAATSGCTDEGLPPGSKQDKVRPIRFTEVSPYLGEEISLFPGRVRAERQPGLSFRVPGRVSTITVDVGDSVTSGTLVAQLDASDYATRVADAKAAVAQARAEAARTRRTAERNERLFAGKALSESERDQAVDVAAAAAARLESAVQRLALAERELSYTRLVAPESGLVVGRFVDPSTNVEAGQSVLQMTGSSIEVRADVPETALSRAQVGATVQVRFPALGAEFHPAEVARITTGATGRQVLYPVFLRLSDESLRPAPGMAAEVQLGNGHQSDANLMSVPPTSIAADPDGPFVWVLEDAEVDPTTKTGSPSEQENTLLKVRRRGIRLTQITGRYAVISEGLRPGERVATAGVTYLHEGQVVRPATMPPLVADELLAPVAPSVNLGPSGERVSR